RPLRRHPSQSSSRKFLSQPEDGLAGGTRRGTLGGKLRYSPFEVPLVSMADRPPSPAKKVLRARVLAHKASEHGEALEEVACPLCDSEASEVHLVGKDLLYGQPGTYPVVRCSSCGLSYVNPRPTFEALAVHYPDDYFCYVPPEESPALLRPSIVSMAR